MLGLGDVEESAISRNLLSLAEVLVVWVVDKWEVNMWLMRPCTFRGLPPVPFHVAAHSGPLKNSFSTIN